MFKHQPARRLGIHCAEFEGGYQNIGKNRPWLPENKNGTKDRNGHGHVRMGMVAGDRRPPMRKSKKATLEMERTLHVYHKRRQNKKNTTMKMQEHILVYNYNNPPDTKMTTHLHLHHALTPPDLHPSHWTNHGKDQPALTHSQQRGNSPGTSSVDAA